jgi:hypothetical protein
MLDDYHPDAECGEKYTRMGIIPKDKPVIALPLHRDVRSAAGATGRGAMIGVYDESVASLGR